MSTGIYKFVFVQGDAECCCKVHWYLLTSRHFRKQYNIKGMLMVLKAACHSPSGSVGVPLKMSRYVVRNTAPSAGSKGGPPISPVASSRPSGTKWTRMASITSSSPGNSNGLSSLGCTDRRRRGEGLVMTLCTEEEVRRILPLTLAP